MNVPAPLHWCFGIMLYAPCSFRQRLVIWIVILPVEYDGPARRKDIVVGVEIVGLEVETTEDRRDAQGLAIGQMN